MTTEDEIRKKVQTLQQLYTDLISYAVVNVALLCVWVAFDQNGVFWPKYVIVVWGLVLMFKAYRMALVPLFFQYIAFLTPEWENKKVDEIMGKRPLQRKVFLKRDVKK